MEDAHPLPVQYVSRWLLVCNFIVAIIYFSWWFIPGHVSNPWLYALLFTGEIYHILMSFFFWLTIWPRKQKIPMSHTSQGLPWVDIFITVAGEPAEIVTETVHAVKAITYERKRIYILNDGYVTQKDNWQAIETLADTLGIFCITRKQARGAKAGNINMALPLTKSPYIAIFDADMKPLPTFLQVIMPYFTDDNVAFVQTPQYYQNNQDSVVSQGAWDQQAFFFGPIMVGKQTSNAAFICGTNVVIARKALVAVGGLLESSIAEDFVTSLFFHQKGYRSVYLNLVLAQGLAPHDLSSYAQQQYRWARGSLDLLFRFNPIFRKGLTWAQKREYLASVLFYINGIILLIDILTPIIYFYTGQVPVTTNTQTFALLFFPYMFLTLYTLSASSGATITFKAIAFSSASFWLQLQALASIATGKKATFTVTSKQAIGGNFVMLCLPHILYGIATFIGIGYSASSNGLSPSLITNSAWALLACVFFIPYVISAFASLNTSQADQLVKGPVSV